MKIRKYKESDKEKILQLSSRLNEFEFLNYRDIESMNKIQLELAMKSILDNSKNIFVAEKNEKFLGYLEMAKEKDYFTGKEVAYISSIIVATDSVGTGVGKALINKAEEWSIMNDCTELVLDVFKGNKNAIEFYEHFGFEEEIVKMVKSVIK